MMNFDEMLDELGEMGRFQIMTYTLVCLPVLFAGANSLSYAFTAGVPNYRCFVPACDALTEFPEYQQPWLETAIPNRIATNADYQPEQCLMFAYDGDDNNCNPGQFRNETEACHHWVFDKERTIVNEFNITCRENQWKLSVVGNSHFLGIFAGSFFFGVMSDRYGRKYTFIASIMLMCLAGVAHILANSYYTFVGLAFIHAVGTAGVYPLGFVIGVELVGRKKRELTGVVLNFFYAAGEAILGGIAWLYPNWRIIQLFVSAPCVLFLIYVCLIPESVRWLMAKKKNRKAQGIVYKAAKINKVTLSKQVEDSFKESKNLKEEVDENAQMWPVVKSMLRSKVLVIRSVIVFYMWAANAFIFYGLSLNATSMSGNKYLNFILVSLVEIPGYSIAWVAIMKLGRKKALIISLFVCAFMCMVSAFFTDITWLLLTTSLIGKLCITSSFGILYVYTSEMFPTVVRGAGVATGSTIGRLGAFLAPSVPLLGLYFAYLPMMLFSTFALIGAILAFKLPETLNTLLPETVEDSLKLK